MFIAYSLLLVSYNIYPFKVMLKNYLLIAFRNLLRHKLFSFINILGLAIGMAACLLIIQYVTFELSYDFFHEKKDRIYRIPVDFYLANG